MDRSILRTGTPMSHIGLGGAQLGNLGRAITDDDAASAVDEAWDRGVRLFDTAPHYGLGLSERRLGAALASRPRDEYVLSTKVGRLLEPSPATATQRDEGGFDVPAETRRVWDFSRDGVRRSLDASLERLGVDAVDIVYLHDPDDHFETAVTEAIPALLALRDEGVIGAVGVGMNQSAMPTEFIRRSDIDVVMLAGRYTLLEQPALDDLLPLAEERGIGIVNAGVYNSGLLAQPRVAPGATYNYLPAPPELITRVDRIADLCEAFGTTLPVAALQFPFRHPAVVSVVVGCRDRRQVDENLRRYEAPVPDALWTALAHEGLIPIDR